jgi:hypothetical protein
MDFAKSLPATIISLPFVIPTQEGSHRIAIMLYYFSLSFPLFASMQKVEQKNGGKHEWLRPFCQPTHSNTPIL